MQPTMYLYNICISLYFYIYQFYTIRGMCGRPMFFWSHWQKVGSQVQVVKRLGTLGLNHQN